MRTTMLPYIEKGSGALEEGVKPHFVPTRLCKAEGSKNRLAEKRMSAMAKVHQVSFWKERSSGANRRADRDSIQTSVE